MTTSAAHVRTGDSLVVTLEADEPLGSSPRLTWTGPGGATVTSEDLGWTGELASDRRRVTWSGAIPATAGLRQESCVLGPLTLVDAAGNAATARPTGGGFVLDDTEPVVSLVVQRGGDTRATPPPRVRQSHQVQVSLQPSERASVRVDSPFAGLCSGLGSGPRAPGRIDRGRWPATTGASPSGAITALARDEAGNEAASASWRRIIDNTPPGAQRLSRQPSNRPVGQSDVGVLTLAATEDLAASPVVTWRNAGACAFRFRPAQSSARLFVYELPTEACDRVAPTIELATAQLIDSVGERIPVDRIPPEARNLTVTPDPAAVRAGQTVRRASSPRTPSASLSRLPSVVCGRSTASPPSP